MPRKSKFTGEYKKRGKNPIPFPHIVLHKKKVFYFRIVSEFPAILAIRPIMWEHFPDEYKGIIASDNKYLERINEEFATSFYNSKRKKVVFLVKGIFPAKIILDQYLTNFPKGYKGILVRCEESFYKMRMKDNNL